LVKFAAMRRASCLVSLLVAERRSGWSSNIPIVFYDEATRIQS
jgi:hypothetical protein